MWDKSKAQLDQQAGKIQLFRSKGLQFFQRRYVFCRQRGVSDPVLLLPQMSKKDFVFGHEENGKEKVMDYRGSFSGSPPPSKYKNRRSMPWKAGKTEDFGVFPKKGLTKQNSYGIIAYVA